MKCWSLFGQHSGIFQSLPLFELRNWTITFDYNGEFLWAPIYYYLIIKYDTSEEQTNSLFMCIWLLQRCTGQVQKYWTITSMRLRSQFVRRLAGLSIIWLFWLVCHVLAPIIRGRTRLNFFGDQQSSLQPKLELWPQRLRARCPPSRKACNSIFLKNSLKKKFQPASLAPGQQFALPPPLLHLLQLQAALSTLHQLKLKFETCSLKGN